MLNWRNLREDDYFLYARSFREAAKKLAGTFDAEPGPLAEFDVCPMLFMYRQAVLLHLKVLIVGDGGNFLRTRPDELSLHKSKSLPWLAQFVSQIVMALDWEDEFKCEGVEDLGDFRALIEQANAIDPGFHAFRCPLDEPGARLPEDNTKLAVRDLVRRLDSLLELLDRTADGLAAEWALRSEPVENNENGPMLHSFRSIRHVIE